MNNVSKVFSDKAVSKADFIKSLQVLEDTLLALPGAIKRYDPVLKYEHRFAPGLYAREITIPAGMVLTTGIHKTEHFAIVSKGKCIVATEDGTECIEAPHTIHTMIGTKRAILVLEELVWTTIHAIDATTEEEAIEMIEYKSWDEFELRGMQ